MTSQWTDFPSVWRWRKRLGDRYGTCCRVVARGAMNSVWVEFEDGVGVMTSGHAVREAGAGEKPTLKRAEVDHLPLLYDPARIVGKSSVKEETS